VRHVRTASVDSAGKRRLVDVDDVADAVEFLMGDKAKSI
jgi:hypothetical protein